MWTAESRWEGSSTGASLVALCAHWVRRTICWALWHSRGEGGGQQGKRCCSLAHVRAVPLGHHHCLLRSWWRLKLQLSGFPWSAKVTSDSQK